MAPEASAVSTKEKEHAFGDNRLSPVPANVTFASTGLVSVVVSCCGQLEFTRLCVPSLLRHCRNAYELLFLDVGSLDGTAEYLAGVKAAAPVRVEVVRTLTDSEIPSACARLLSQVKGDFIVFLNNDTLVAANWLERLVALAQLSPRIGLVGAMSNMAAPPQRVQCPPYRIRSIRSYADGGNGDLVDVSEVEAFAHQWHEQNRGKWLEVDYLGGFCLLGKRAVLDFLGPIETKSGLNVFDTDTLCLKVRQAGYVLACCQDLFVHHFGSRMIYTAQPAPLS